MKPSDALEWIRNTFNNPSRCSELAESIAEEQYIKVLDAIKCRLPYRKGQIGNSISMFFFCGCLKFDRWITPTPYVLNPRDREYFDRFINELSLSEEDNRNTARFLVDQIKWDLFSLIDRRSPSSIGEHALNELEERLSSIKSPKLHQKKNEFEQIATECLVIITATRKNTLITTIQTRLPVTPVIHPLKIDTVWNDVQTTATFEPIFFNPQNSFVNFEGGVAIPTTPSQWQHGYCEVTLDRMIGAGC